MEVKTPSSALRVRASGRSRCASTASKAARSRCVARRATLSAVSESTSASRAVREASRLRWTAIELATRARTSRARWPPAVEAKAPVGGHAGAVPRAAAASCSARARAGGGVQECVLDRRERRRALLPPGQGAVEPRPAVQLAVRPAARPSQSSAATLRWRRVSSARQRPRPARTAAAARRGSPPRGRPPPIRSSVVTSRQRTRRSTTRARSGVGRGDREGRAAPRPARRPGRVATSRSHSVAHRRPAGPAASDSHICSADWATAPWMPPVAR